MTGFQEIINQNKLVLVNFYKVGYESSEHLNDVLDKIHDKLGDDVTIAKIEVEEHRTFAAKMMIQDVPTLVIFKDGEEIWRENAVPTGEDIMRVLEKAM